MLDIGSWVGGEGDYEAPVLGGRGGVGGWEYVRVLRLGEGRVLDVPIHLLLLPSVRRGRKTRVRGSGGIACLFLCVQFVNWKCFWTYADIEKILRSFGILILLHEK